MSLDLSRLRILVTGGSRGIGAATVRLLSDLGARVAFTYLNQEQAALDLQAELAAQGRTALAIRADQRLRADAQTAVAAVEAAWGGLDAFVGNAGIWAATPAELQDEDILL
ncbi:MAG TPA: SDR family NAD(P)-dependent oxidoreductase, partial [Geothrix sp.]|nr:SDR family NAD(P)-dependent oxidoreductase [Geothrix sp.]